MYVSSYSTYISTSNSDKTQKSREASRETEGSKSSKSTFSLPSTEQVLVSGTHKLPISYISNYKALSTRQQLQEQLQQKHSQLTNAKTKFTKISAMNSAQVSYAENSHMFPLISKPKMTLDQTPKISKRLPEDAQKASESVLKRHMVNIYASNDNYYKITAA